MGKRWSRILAILLCVALTFNSQYIGVLAEEAETSVTADNEVTSDEEASESLEENTSSVEDEDSELLSESTTESCSESVAEASTESLTETEEESEEVSLEADSMSQDEWANIFASGNGSESSPFIIMDEYQLENFNKNFYKCSNSHKYYYELRSDINYKGKVWTPLVGTDKKITSFNGGNYTIRNLTIVADDNIRYGNSAKVAMFQEVGELKNLNVLDVEIVEKRSGIQKSNADYAVLCYNLDKSSTIKNCNIKGDIKLTIESANLTAINSLSGYATYNRGSIDSCLQYATITGDGFVSGIAYRNYGTINKCKNLGKICPVTGEGTYSGIVYQNYYDRDVFGEIKDCRNEANITAEGSNSRVFGIVGSNNCGTISGCYNKGKLSGNTVAGIADSLRGGTITECDNEGEINGVYASGIVNDAYHGELTKCENRGKVHGTNAAGCLQCNGHGFDEDLKITKCSNSGEVVGSERASGIILRIWTEDYSKGKFKMLSCSNEGKVSHSEDNKTLYGTAGIVYEVWGYSKETDVLIIEKCSNVGTVNSKSTVGGIAASVRGNVSFVECFNEGSVCGNIAGGIVYQCYPYEIEDENGEGTSSYLTTSIDRCYNTGDVSTINGSYSPYAAGIVGDLNTGTVNACYNSGTISSKGEVAGIAAKIFNYETDTSISNCYNAGNVESLATERSFVRAGGIAGYMWNSGEHLLSITNCYNSGTISSKDFDNKYTGQLFGDAYIPAGSDSYWDISGCYYSTEFGSYAGEECFDDGFFRERTHGVTTAALKQQSTFDGFDFSQVWSMGNDEYPYPVLSCIGAGDAFRITYILADGKNNPKNVSRFYQGDTVTLYAPTRDGYDFDGWYTDSGYSEQITEISGEIRKNIIIYAKWLKGNEYLEDVTVNGKGHAYLWGTLYSEKGDRQCNTEYKWYLYEINDQDETQVSSGSASTDGKGRYCIETPEVSTSNKYSPEFHDYKIRFTMKGAEGEIPLRYFVFARVYVKPFSYKQSWDIGGGITGDASGNIGFGKKEIGDATFEATLGGLGVNGNLGRRVKVDIENDSGTKNLKIRNDLSSKVGVNLSFGPKFEYKKGESEKFSTPVLGASAGATYGSTITPGLEIKDYDPNNAEDMRKLGTFLIQSTAYDTGNMLLVGLVDIAANEWNVDYVNLTEHNTSVSVKAGSSFKANASSGLGFTQADNVSTNYSYSESLKYYVAEDCSKTTSYKADKNTKGSSKIKLFGKDADASLSVGSGDSFSISTNYGQEIEWLSFSLTESNTSKVSFVINGEKSSTKKTTVKYKGDQAKKVCRDVYAFSSFANGSTQYIYNSAHDSIIEGVRESEAVASYSISDDSKYGVGVSVPISIPGFSVTPDFSGAYSESYTVESGIYSGGESLKQSDCTETLQGTDSTEVSSILSDPFVYCALELYKLAENKCLEVKNKMTASIVAFEAKVEVTREQIDNAKNYVVHIVTTGKSTAQSGSYKPTSYEVCKVNPDSELSLQEAASDETVYTVGFPHLIYLIDESDEVKELPENERTMDKFPAGDTCTLTISYTLEELRNAGINDINGGNLNIFRYSDELQGYECVGGNRDFENKAVSVEISKPGQYILAIDNDIPVVRGIEVSDHSSTPVITVNIDEKSGFGVLSFKIDNVEVIDASNYKPYYSIANNLLTYQIEEEDALADGVHTISIYAVDTAGNGMVAPETLEFRVHNAKPEVESAKCYFEGNDIRVRATLKEMGTAFEEAVYLEDVDEITADVTEIHLGEDEVPEVITSSFNLGMAGKECYITGFGERQYADSSIAKFVITIKDIYGNETVKEFDCSSSEGEGLVISGNAVNDLWYYMPEKSMVYTGMAIKPLVYVFDGDKLLVEKKDYSLAYKDNTNASKYSDGSESEKQPCITVTGKGNYTQKDNIYFDITQKDITDEDVIIADPATVLSNGKPQKPSVAIIWGKKKLAVGKDYSISYCQASGDEPTYSEPEIIPEAAGDYFVIVKAAVKGNYKGQTFKNYKIADKDTYKLISKVTVKKIKDKSFTGSPLMAETDEIIVSDGKTPLIEGVDYTVSYSDNSDDYTDVGTVIVTLTGMGNYIGTKQTSYKITGIPISKASISSEQIKKNYFVYDGLEHTLTDLVLTYKFNKTDVSASELYGVEKSEYDKMSSYAKRDYQYTYEYLNNVNAGTATVIISGAGGFTGSVKKTFKIGKYTIKKNVPSDVLVSLENTEYEYTYPAVTPKPVVIYYGRILKEGRDYTLAYSNNKAVNDGSNAKKLPTVTVKPIGNFAGSPLSCTFTISAADISSGGLLATAPDKVYSDKKGAWKSVATVTGTDGKKVTAKGNYATKPVYKYDSFTDEDGYTDTVCYDVKNIKNSKSPTYEIRNQGDLVDDYDIVPAGTTISIVLAGEGNYAGELLATYRVTKYDIGKLTVTVDKPKTYTTREVKLKKSDITIKKGKDILSDVTYEIDDSTYRNNVNKGKASVVIRGYGEYGGSKIVNYSIGVKQFRWWKF